MSTSDYQIQKLQHITCLGAKFPNVLSSYSGVTDQATSEFNYYEEYSKTIAVTGARSVNLTGTFRRTGKTVTFTLSALSSANADAGATIDGAAGSVPTRFVPSASSVFLIQVTNNAALATGTITIGTDGAITIGGTVAGAAFTNAAACAFSQFSVTYHVA